MNLQESIESSITTATGTRASIEKSRQVSGGSINNSRIVTLKDGREFFIKSHPDASLYPGMFEAEYKGLALLSESRTVRVPRPVAVSGHFIVLETFRETERSGGWHEKIGRQLAQLHMATRTTRFGFERDNYLGTNQQHNAWMNDWPGFWRDQRLGWQLELYARKADPGDRLLQLGDRLMAKLDMLLRGIDEPAVLLHGDLWSGNSAADETGEPVVFDPACYYGQREAEFGMMRMFGGYGPRCEAAYDEVWPRPAGTEERISLYRLYHELNHLNLFGRSYYQDCIATMERLV
jgi:fructosamine-3-kinase